MQLELNLLSRDELQKAVQLIGVKNKKGELDILNRKELQKIIHIKVNPRNISLRSQYYKALDLFKIKYETDDYNSNLKKKLYEYNARKMDEYIAKLKPKEKELLSKQLEKNLDKKTLDYIIKYGEGTAFFRNGVLVLQGGAVLITGSNLGISLLLTQGLSAISTVIGVTFPFAAYTTLAILGGHIVAVAGFLANPLIAGPMFGSIMYALYVKYNNQQYIKLAGINYLIESKKLMHEEYLYLDYGFDEDIDFCIWKGNKDEIAFAPDDVPVLIARLKELLSGNISEFSFERVRFGSFNAKITEDYYRLQGNQRVYNCRKEELEEIIDFFGEETGIKFAFDEDHDFRIWKGNYSKIVFQNNFQIEELICGINSLLGENKNLITVDRGKFGKFIAEADGNGFKLHGNKGYYTCSRIDLIRILNYLKKSKEPI